MTKKQGQKTDGAANRAAIQELQLSVSIGVDDGYIE